MKRLLFIYNPHAGKELLKPKLSDIVDIFVKAGYEVVIYPTQAYQDAYKKVRRYPAGEYDLVVCSGGDGTIDEVVTGMMKRQEKNPIGYIPTGTVGYIPTGSTNDFANSLHIPRNLLGAADNAVNGVVFPCDVGKFNDGTFVYIAAFGLFTDVSYETDQDLKNVLGHVAYLLEGVKRLFDIKSYHMKVTSEEIQVEDDFIVGMITNSRSVGGFKNLTGKNVDMNDGLFEVTLIRHPKNPLQLQEIMTALVMAEDNTDMIYSFKSKKLMIETEEEVPWTLDGEFGGDHTYVEIENRHKALNLYLKSTKAKE